MRFRQRKRRAVDDYKCCLEQLEERTMLAGAPLVEELEATGESLDGYLLDAGDLDHAEQISQSGLDQVLVRFSEDVQVQHGDLVVRGMNHPDSYDIAADSFSYDPDTFTASWTLAAPLAADRLSIQIADTVEDTAGQRIVGQRTYRADVLTGDVDRSGSVGRSDLVANLRHQVTRVGDAGFDVDHDVNGDGLTNIVDLVHVRDHLGETLPNGRPEQAETVTELSAALQFAPTRIYEYVYNNFEHQLYAGLMKGPQATLETRAGNSWDQSALLVEAFDRAGITAHFVTGRVDIPADVAKAWIGATNTIATSNILLNVLTNAQGFLDANNERIQLDHIWVEAELPDKDSTRWTPMDVAIKEMDFQHDLSNILTTVPFDHESY